MAISKRSADILRELCRAEDRHVPVGELAQALSVSSKTVSRDCRRWNACWQHEGWGFRARPGQGVYIEGTEDARRRAIIRHLYEHMDEKFLLGLVAGEGGEAAAPKAKTVSRAQQELLQLVGRDEIGAYRDSPAGGAGV